MNNTGTSGHYDAAEATPTEDDEEDITSSKRAKIGDLKDMNVSGETSPCCKSALASCTKSTRRLLRCRAKGHNNPFFA